jgi:N-methylhydantoinase B
MSEKKIDTLTVEIIREALPSICDEMSVVLRRTAYNMFIYEILDFSTAFVDSEGDLIGQNRGVFPLMAGALREIIASGVEEIGKENFLPGDIIAMNIPFITGQHLNNVAIYKPVFFDGKLVGFPVAFAHWMDLGGSKLGLGFVRTVDVYQEGLQFRNIKIYEAGKPNKTFFRILQDNLRRPDLTLGDLRAMVSSCNIGEERFLAILQKYGLDTVKEAVRIIDDQSEERTRKGVAKIPDGVYEAESFLDNDGINMDKTIPVKVKVTVKGSEMVVDFTGTSPQVQGPLNTSKGALIISRAVLKFLTDPTSYATQGSFRPVKVIIPPGTFLSATPPAAMASWSMGLATVADTILKALSPAVPNLVPAAHKGDQGDFGFYGIDSSTGKYWFCGNIRGGGHGGRPHEDGESASCNILQGDVTTAPVEMLEQKYPFFVENYNLIQDSGGAGKFRGGLGTEWRIRSIGVDPIFCNIGGERYKCRPWGLWGGKEGSPNHYLLYQGEGKEPEVVTKRPATPVPQKGWVALRSGGGGGWGDPLDRDPTRVLTDVTRGYVSMEKAVSDYGVVIDFAEKRVDEAATRVLREKMRREGKGI